MTTGHTNSVISSTNCLSSSQRIRAPLPCTCSSPPGLALRSAMAVARSSERTVVSDHFGSVSVVDAMYLGLVFKAAAMGWILGSPPRRDRAADEVIAQRPRQPERRRSQEQAD